MLKLAYKIHRIVSYFLFIQITFWVLGGVVFSILPFNSIVKGGAVVDKPVQDFSVVKNPQWLKTLDTRLGNVSTIKGLSTYPTSQGLALKVQYEDRILWLRLSDGQTLEPPNRESVEKFAQSIYKGDGQLLETRFLEESEYRYLGLVDEMNGKTHVWQASFDDHYGTRLYFTGDSGEYLTVRNDYWVLYDALWRLHIMDYKHGDDFNNTLLRIFALSTFIFVLSGLVLSINALLRAVSRMKKS